MEWWSQGTGGGAWGVTDGTVSVWEDEQVLETGVGAGRIMT